MRHARLSVGVVLLGQATACGLNPEVRSTSPETGPYGTIVTVEGNSLPAEGGRVEFENGVTVPNDHLLHASGSKITFRVPSPARGRFRLASADEALTAGEFEPDPWRPLALLEPSSESVLLDFAVFGPDSAAELRRESGVLKALFYEQEDFAELVVPDAGEPSAAVVWSERSQELQAFALELTDDDPILRALEIDRAGAQHVATVLPEDATELLAFDRENGLRFAFVADVDEQEILKYEWTARGLEQSWITPDPATTNNSRFAARGGHAWRAWTVPRQSSDPLTGFDVTFRVMAAYLAPGSSDFQPALDLGGGDDSASRFEILGMTDAGELALEFCAKNSDITASTLTRCQSLVVGPDGVLRSSVDDQGTPRTLPLALGSGLYELVCEDGAQALHAPGDPLGDPLLSPCVDRVPPYRLGLDGRPGFLVGGAATRMILTRY